MSLEALEVQFGRKRFKSKTKIKSTTIKELLTEE